MEHNYVQNHLHEDWKDKVEFSYKQGDFFVNLPAGSSFGLERFFNPRPWHFVSEVPVFSATHYAEVYTISVEHFRMILEVYPYQELVLKKLFKQKLMRGSAGFDFIHRDHKVQLKEEMEQCIMENDKSFRRQVKLRTRSSEEIKKEEMTQAAYRIQAYVRGWLMRHELQVKRHLEEEDAVIGTGPGEEEMSLQELEAKIEDLQDEVIESQRKVSRMKKEYLELNIREALRVPYR